MAFSESDGKIAGFSITGKVMVAWSVNNYLRMFDLARREYKQVGVTRRFENNDGLLGKIKNCAINADGTKVAIIADAFNKSTKDKFFVYDCEMDNFTPFELPEGRNVMEIIWDVADSRFFAVLTEYAKAKAEANEDSEE